MERGVPTRLSAPEGRKFAFTLGMAFLVFGGVGWWRDHQSVAAGLGLLSAGLIIAGIAIPGRLTLLHRYWMGLALLLSKVTTPIFMAGVFFLVLAPTGLLMRAFGHNELTREPVDGSFWVARSDRPGEQGDLTRQF